VGLGLGDASPAAASVTTVLGLGDELTLELPVLLPAMSWLEFVTVSAVLLVVPLSLMTKEVLELNDVLVF
jgi:hypothetical protein